MGAAPFNPSLVLQTKIFPQLQPRIDETTNAYKQTQMHPTIVRVTRYVDVGAEGAQVAGFRAHGNAVLPGDAVLAGTSASGGKGSNWTGLLFVGRNQRHFSVHRRDIMRAIPSGGGGSASTN